jgi:hypothetical protein
MATKIRYFRSTKGENAEVIVGKAVPYTAQADIASFQSTAVEGEIGVFNADTNLAISPAVALGTPQNVVVTGNAAGGALAAGTYYYKIVAVNAVGVSLGSSEVNVTTTGSTSSAQLSWNDVAGATSYRVYRGTSAAGEDHYQVSGGNTFIDAGAVGTTGTVPVAATGTTPTPLVAGNKYYIALKRDGNSFRSTNITFDGTRTRRTPYIAPVKQVTTVTISAASVTYINTLIAAQVPFSLTDNVNYAGLTTIETTPGNEPFPTIDWDYEFDNPAGVTVSAILTKIVADINNPLDLRQKDDGQQYTAALSGNDGAGYTVTVTAFYFQQHFRIALRGLLASGTVVYTTPYKQGVGDSDSVGYIEKEGFIYAGVTTNYPGAALPSEFGRPSEFTVAGLTYNTYQLDPLRVSKEPMPQSVHHHYAHIYVIVPVPVGGSASARAASSPDYILGSILGFTLTP